MARLPPPIPVGGRPAFPGGVAVRPLGVGPRTVDLSRPANASHTRPPPERRTARKHADGGEASGRKTCGSCGVEAEPGDKFCGVCAAPLFDEDSPVYTDTGIWDADSFALVKDTPAAAKKKRPSSSLPPTHTVPPGGRHDEWQGKVVPKSQWQADDQTEICNGCQTLFTMINRKHHCRKCGMVFCASCSMSRAVIPVLHSYHTHRLCDKCAADLLPAPDAQRYKNTLQHVLSHPPGLTSPAFRPEVIIKPRPSKTGAETLASPLSPPLTPVSSQMVRSQSASSLTPTPPLPPAFGPSGSFIRPDNRSASQSMHLVKPSSPVERTPPPLPDTPTRRSAAMRPANAKYLTSAEAHAKDAGILRLCDYFCIFGMGKLRTDNLGTVESVTDLAFEGCLNSNGRYPVLDWKECPLSPNAFMFAFPRGLRLHSGTKGHEKDTFETGYLQRSPKLHRFVLTKLDGGKQYCSCLQFCEPWSRDEVKSLLRAAFSEAKTQSPEKASVIDACQSKCLTQLDQPDEVYYVPRAICLMSQQAYYTLMDEFLKTLYQIMKDPSNEKPCERYITNLIHEIDLPKEGNAIEFIIGDKTILFTRPGPEELPMADLDFRLLFRCLPPDLILMVYACLATEQKIVFCSSFSHVLIGVVECMCALLYPFEWQGVYMPLLPEKLGDFLYAPVPFIAGVLRSSIEAGSMDIPDELIFLDIDTADFRVPSVETLVYLPEKISRKLGKIIRLNADLFDSESPLLPMGEYAFLQGEDMSPSDMAYKPPEVNVQDLNFTPEEPSKVFSRSPQIPFDTAPFDIAKIRRAFFDMWLGFLAPYKTFIRSPAPGVEQRDDEFFDSVGFINDAPKANRGVIKGITDTQMFARLLNDWMAVAQKTADDETSRRVKNLDEAIAAYKQRKSRKSQFDKMLNQSNESKESSRGSVSKSKSWTKTCAPSAHFNNVSPPITKSSRFPSSLNAAYYEKSVQSAFGLEARSPSMPGLEVMIGRNNNDQITHLAAGLSYDFERVRRVTSTQRAAAASKPVVPVSGIIVSFKPGTEKKRPPPLPPILPSNFSTPPRPPAEPKPLKPLVERLAPSGAYFAVTPEEFAAAIGESVARRQQNGNIALKQAPKPATRLPQERFDPRVSAHLAKQASDRRSQTVPAPLGSPTHRPPFHPTLRAPPPPGGELDPRERLSQLLVARASSNEDREPRASGDTRTSHHEPPPLPRVSPEPRLSGSISAATLAQLPHPTPNFPRSPSPSVDELKRKDREEKERKAQEDEQERKDREEQIRKLREEREERERRQREEREKKLREDQERKQKEREEREERERRQKEEREERERKLREENEKRQREREENEKRLKEEREKEERDREERDRREKEKKEKEERDKREKEEKERERKERDRDKEGGEKEPPKIVLPPRVVSPPVPSYTPATKPTTHAAAMAAAASSSTTNAAILAAQAAAAAALAAVASTNQPVSQKKSIIDPYNVFTPSYTLDELRKFKMSGVDRTQREAYLSQEDFEAAFGMTRDMFYQLPKWKRQDSKVKLGIF